MFKDKPAVYFPVKVAHSPYGIVPSTSPAGKPSTGVTNHPDPPLFPHTPMFLAAKCHTPVKSLPVPVRGVSATTQYLVPEVTASGEKLATVRVPTGRFVTVTGPASRVPG